MKRRRGDFAGASTGTPSTTNITRDIVVALFVVCLLLLAVLQLHNVMSWCGDPDLRHEIVMDLWMDMQPGDCDGPIFSRLASGKLDMSECVPENHPSYSQTKLEKFKPYVAEYLPPITGETVWTRCEFGFTNVQENILVQNVFDEDILQDALARAPLLSFSAPSASSPVPSPASDYLSVVVVLVSSLSSDHFARMMTSTSTFLKGLGKSHNDAYEAFHFSRYNIVGADAVTNQLAMFAGSAESGPSNTWVWDYFHRLGYLTMYGEEDCVYKDSIKNDIPRNSKDSMIDVEFADVYCDESMNDPRASGRIWRHGASCIGNRHVHTLLMSYTQDFLNNYCSVPRFITNIFQTANEPTQTRVKTMDKDMYNYLSALTTVPKPEIKPPQKHTSINATSSPIIFLLSEQGESDSPYFHNTRAGFVEHKRPLLYVLAPRAWLTRYPQVRQNLLMNKEKIITPFDIYETFTHIPRLPLISTHRETIPATKPPQPNTRHETYSIFDNIPADRTCERGNIPGKFCVCEASYMFVVVLMLLPGLLMGWWLYTWCVSRKAKRTVYVNNIQFR